MWSFEVRGAPPEYSVPVVPTRIDNKMDAETMSRMASKAEQSRSRNIMRENMNVAAPKSVVSSGSVSGLSSKGPSSVVSFRGK